jgi:hypothetical protein
MQNFFNLREKFKKPKPPFKDMHITGFEGKFKLNIQAMHADNRTPQVIKDVKAAIKIVDKHLKKLGMKMVPANIKGPSDIAKENGIKVGEGALDFVVSVFPGFKNDVKLPKGKTEDDINLDPMVDELSKLKSFANFPRTDWSANYGQSNN